MTHLTDVAAATRRREPSDVPQERIGVLDVARGIAILGTLATNIWIFTDPGGIIGYLVTAAAEPDRRSRADRADHHQAAG